MRTWCSVFRSGDNPWESNRPNLKCSEEVYIYKDHSLIKKTSARKWNLMSVPRNGLCSESSWYLWRGDGPLSVRKQLKLYCSWLCFILKLEPRPGSMSIKNKIMDSTTERNEPNNNNDNDNNKNYTGHSGRILSDRQ